jgi:hypothetical protein
MGDLSGWDVSNVKDFSGMFYYAARDVASFNFGNLGKWNVSSAEDFINAILGAASGDSMSELIAAEYGDDYTTEFKVIKSEKIDEDAAADYINKTKNMMDEYADSGFSSSDIKWNDIEEYAVVNAEQIISGSIKDETNEVTLVLGYIDNEWKVVFVEDDSEELGLYSLSFLEGMLG